MNVKIYTTPTCVYCHALMDWLDEEGVDYEEVDASNPDNVKDMDINGVPVTVVDSDNGRLRIDGFDRRAIKKALKL